MMNGATVTGDLGHRGRIYYGWPMVTAVRIAQLVLWGVLYYGFSVFVPPERTDLDWSLPAIAGAFSVAIILSGAAAPFVGRWIDTYGPRAGCSHRLASGYHAATSLP